MPSREDSYQHLPAIGSASSSSSSGPPPVIKREPESPEQKWFHDAHQELAAHGAILIDESPRKRVRGNPLDDSEAELDAPDSQDL
jgi:hypothetical protein